MKWMVVLLLSLALSVTASGREHLADRSREMSGSMMPYDFSRVDDKPIWPDSLQPVYAAHVARHGARFISSAKKVRELRNFLTAHEGNLTPKGRRFIALLDSVENVTAGRWGQLSEIGVNEENMIAGNLYTLLPNLMKKARIEAISTYVPRVVMSMYAFCHCLSIESSDVEISTSEGRQYDRLLRSFETDSAYAKYRKDGDWEMYVRHLEDSTVSPEPARALIKDERGIAESSLRTATMDMYGILQSLTAFGMEAPTEEFMSETEYHSCWEVDNLAHFLRNTVSPISNAAARATAPLLARIIKDADRMTATCNFYFGHAETLMPLLSLMRLPGCYDDSTDFYSVSERWKDYEVVPLGANLDIIILASPSDVRYVAMRLNGHFVAPMEGNARKILKWDSYKDYLSTLSGIAILGGGSR